MTKLIYLLGFLLLSNIGFSQTQNYWTKKKDFTGLKRERAIAFSINGKGYIGTGVDTADVVHKDLWEYNPTLNTWTQKADIASVRRNAIAFAINDKGYVGTGMDSAFVGTGKGISGKKMSMYVYTPYAVLSNNENNLESINVFPNPIEDKINLTLNSTDTKYVSIVNINGKIISHQKTNYSQLTINRNNQPSGIYFLIVLDENSMLIHSQKLIFK